LPELSVDGLHARETLNGVTAVTRKFLGAVGLIVSRHAKAGKANINANARTTPLKHAFARKLLTKEDLHSLVINEPFSNAHFVGGHGSPSQDWEEQTP
jgi:hypothetical protein